MGALVHFGAQRGTTSYQMPLANTKSVTKLQNLTGYAVPVTKAWVYWGATVASTTKLKAVLYSDVSNAPVALLGVSAEVAGHADGWVPLTFSPAVVIPNNGYVWAGVIADHDDYSSGWLSGAGTSCINADSYSTGPASLFGTPTSTLGYSMPVMLEGRDGQQRFGRATFGNEGATFNGGWQYGQAFVLDEPGPVKAQSIALYHTTASATTKIKAAIFSDLGGVPNTKLAQSVEVTGHSANAWLTLPLSAQVVLAPGTYWIVHIADGSRGGTQLNYPSVDGKVGIDSTEAEATAFASPSLMASFVTQKWFDMYVNYVPSPANPLIGHGWKPRAWQQAGRFHQSFKRPS